jgi:hypothetical protein
MVQFDRETWRKSDKGLWLALCCDAVTKGDLEGGLLWFAVWEDNVGHFHKDLLPVVEAAMKAGFPMMALKALRFSCAAGVWSAALALAITECHSLGAVRWLQTEFALMPTSACKIKLSSLTAMALKPAISKATKSNDTLAIRICLKLCDKGLLVADLPRQASPDMLWLFKHHTRSYDRHLVSWLTYIARTTPQPPCFAVSRAMGELLLKELTSTELAMTARA